MYANLVCMIVALSLIIASLTVATWLTVLVNDSVQVIDTMVKKIVKYLFGVSEMASKKTCLIMLSVIMFLKNIINIFMFQK